MDERSADEGGEPKSQRHAPSQPEVGGDAAPIYHLQVNSRTAYVMLNTLALRLQYGGNKKGQPVPTSTGSGSAASTPNQVNESGRINVNGTAAAAAAVVGGCISDAGSGGGGSGTPSSTSPPATAISVTAAAAAAGAGNGDGTGGGTGGGGGGGVAASDDAHGDDEGGDTEPDDDDEEDPSERLPSKEELVHPITPWLWKLKLGRLLPFFLTAGAETFEAVAKMTEAEVLRVYLNTPESKQKPGHLKMLMLGWHRLCQKHGTTLLAVVT